MLIALMTSMALAAMDTTIVSTAIPQVVRDLGGFSLFSWVFSSYLLTQTVSIPVMGRLADQWGRKPVLIAGTLIFLGGSALCASSATMVSLILFRGLQGIGAGGVQATYLHENVRRTRHRIDVAGGAAIFVAAGALIFGLLQGGVAWAWWSLPGLASSSSARPRSCPPTASRSSASGPWPPPACSPR